MKGRTVDLNLVVLAGRLCAPPEVRSIGHQQVSTRYLVAVRGERPRARLEVVPVTLWGETDHAVRPDPGRRIWVAGSLQRRTWASAGNGRMEVVADQVELRDDPVGEPFASGEPGSSGSRH